MSLLKKDYVFVKSDQYLLAVQGLMEGLCLVSK
jgi:hypothetical protein